MLSISCSLLSHKPFIIKSKLYIIHGIGKGILKDTVHKVLKNDKRIEKYYIDFMNPGSTIVEIRKEYYE